MSLDRDIVADLRSAILDHVRSRQRGNVTLTYKELIAKTGRKLTEQGIGQHLTAIGDECEANGQPRLDFLVVNAKTNRPGFPVENAHFFSEIEACRKFPWPLDQSS